MGHEERNTFLRILTPKYFIMVSIKSYESRKGDKHIIIIS